MMGSYTLFDDNGEPQPHVPGRRRIPAPTPAQHLARRDASDTSRAAAQHVALRSAELNALVLDVIRSFGPGGCISDQVRTHPSVRGYSYPGITGRYSALKAQGLIVDTGQRRPGASGRPQAVLVATEHCADPLRYQTGRKSPTIAQFRRLADLTERLLRASRVCRERNEGTGATVRQQLLDDVKRALDAVAEYRQ